MPTPRSTGIESVPTACTHLMESSDDQDADDDPQHSGGPCREARCPDEQRRHAPGDARGDDESDITAHGVTGRVRP
ncbi:hypothetical protein GCM10009851_17580 [Herbiconiux moechotypicola]|uniref:Uncharacterized protein n=1 Tax=Herbiconiux moechotypicola TaxID=637393 RepID=A0ABP5QHM3_9MICO